MSKHKSKDKLKSKDKSLLKEAKPTQNSEVIMMFEHKESDDLNGIFKYLTNKTHGNIHDNGTIEVTFDSIYPSYHPKKLLNTNENDKYQQHGSYHSWVYFDFKEKKVNISSYSIKSCNWSKNIGHIKSWVIEISSNG